MSPTHPGRPASLSSSLEVYLKQIGESALLSAEQERELALGIAAGDRQALQQLVRANLRLVVNVARAYANRGLDLADLIGEGNLGLIRAAEGFDASMQTRFSTYAVYWIKQSIRRALCQTTRPIRLPVYMHHLLAEWRRAGAALDQKLGRPPTEEEVARRLKLRPRQVEFIKKALRVQEALLPGESEDGVALEELAADPRTEAPEVRLAQAEELGEVLRLLSQLKPREAAVLRLRFGLEGEEPRTLKEVGERLCLTRERVRQIEQVALDKLQERLLAC